MNTEFILQRIEPYLNSKRELSEFEFMELFASGDYPLSLKEQYEVINIMINHDIDYVDEKDEELETIANTSNISIRTTSQCTEHLLNLKNEQLAVMAKNGDETALAAIIEKNMKFIFQLAIKIQSQYTLCGLTVDDLAQEGTMGMMEAVRRFDPSKEFALLTYAWSWIRQHMERAILNTGFLIRLPVHVFEKIMKVTRYRKANPYAGIEELMKISESDGSNFTKQQLRLLIKYSEQYINVMSLNTLVGERGDSELMEFLPDDSTSLEDEAINNFLKVEIAEILLTLTEKEANIIKLRFGFNCSSHTLEEIGNIYKVTRERIRQIEAKALRRLRHPSRSAKIKGYLI